MPNSSSPIPTEYLETCPSGLSDGLPSDTALAPPAVEVPNPHGVTVDRAFGFVDLCGFTRFTAEEGPEAAFAALRHFRELVRAVAANRGVRIAKWLGDGCMLVSVTPGPLVATMAELMVRFPAPLRLGVAAGPALLFEADDHIGEPVNRAARLCDSAGPNQLLASPETIEALPRWLVATPVPPLEIRGVGLLSGVCSISLPPRLEEALDAPPLPDAAANL